MPDARESTICLTFDLDWAADFVIDRLTARLDEADLPATVFCTHQSPAVERLGALPRIELALHPSFLGGEGDEQAVLSRLADLFPEARGVRSHALYYHSGLLFVLHRLGLRYLSNEVRFLEAALAPSYDYSGIVRLPIYWEDDVHCVFHGDRPEAFTAERLALHRPGLKVFNFHPIHLFLNTRCLRHYRRNKAALGAPEAAATLRQAGPGTSTLFDALVDHVDRRGVATSTLGGCCDRFTASCNYSGRFGEFVDPV